VIRDCPTARRRVGETVNGKPVFDQAGIIGQLDAGLEIMTIRTA
jgi:hypothetical protein